MGGDGGLTNRFSICGKMGLNIQYGDSDMSLTEQQKKGISANVRRLSEISNRISGRQDVNKDDLISTLVLIDNLHAALLGDEYMKAKKQPAD